MTYAETVKFIVAMIIMLNPLGSLSIFLDLTRSHTVGEKQKTALNCGIAIAIFMVASIWLGSQLLDLLGISIASFRCAGGLILFLMGLSLLQSKESAMNYTPADEAATENRTSIAIVPMALPIIIGPGTISTLVIASNDYPLFWLKSWLSLLCLALAIGMTLLLYYGTTIARLLGNAVMQVITRIMGMLIMSIAVGMLANGIIGLIPALR